MFEQFQFCTACHKLSLRVINFMESTWGFTRNGGQPDLFQQRTAYGSKFFQDFNRSKSEWGCDIVVYFKT